MSDEQAPQALRQPWTPERIQQTMRDEFGVNWAPPAVKDTWKEANAPADSADEWVTLDQKTGQIRTLTSDELFDLTDAGKRTQPGVELADVPVDHPRTERESTYLEGAMKEHGVPAATRAQARWGERMNPDQALAQSMARHPSMRLPSPRPVVS